VSGFVVRGATVIDGTGAPGVVADVAVDGDRIRAVGAALETGSDVEVVDGAGQVLAPGFIDVHTHDDFAAVLYPDMGFKVLGGVTTCVVGNCGMGAAPWRPAAFAAQAFHPGRALPEWDGYAGYLGHLADHPPSVNVAALVGHGTVRAAVLGMEDRAATSDEIDRMRDLLAEGLDAGCVGMSSGLIYEPSRFASTDELVALAELLAERGRRYTSHIRGEDTRLLGAIDEAIEIGRRSGAAVVISHLKSSGRPSWGGAGAVLARIDAARAEGLTVDGDQYPYTAASTVLSAVLPMIEGMGLTPDEVMIASTDGQPDWHGRTLGDLAGELGTDADDPLATAEAVLEAEPLTTCVVHSMSEDDVRTVLARADVMVGSDGIPSLDGHPHPRLFGTFARVLGHYARDVGLLPLETAVHKMTGRAADVFGLADRGVVRAGAVADLVLFDPDRIIDRATFDDPKQPPDGIDGVWVNGVRVVDAGEHTGARPGVPVRA
jgi:N-acyl-D-aspartate/D-glutamate deacylase